MNNNYIRQQVVSSICVKQSMLEDLHLLNQIFKLAHICFSCLQNGGKIIFAGNGGSFSDAQHLAAEFTARFQKNRIPLPSIALATNSSSITAIANDFGFDHVFSRELIALGHSSDVFIPISCSGNSSNVITSIETAIQLKIKTFGLTGSSPGKLSSLCEHIAVPSTNTARIQECHILIGHILCGLIDESFATSSSSK